jgi:acetyl-CoA acetyltransferase
MTSAHRPRSAIIGIAQPDIGDGRQHNLRLIARAVFAALEDAHLTIEDVDGLLVAGFHGLFPALAIAEYLGLQLRYADSTDTGGSAFELHLATVDAAIQAGLCRTALIVYASTQRQDRRDPDLAARESQLAYSHHLQFERPTGLMPIIGAYALAAQRHMYEFGTTPEQLAEIAVAAREWAMLNPAAARRDPLTVADVLASPIVSDPLHILDCCLLDDGAAAAVVTSTRAIADPDRAVQLLGFGHKATHMNITAMPDLVRTGAIDSGKQAFAMAGLVPTDIDVAQIYDSFTITALLNLEDLGFCAKGDGGPFAASGALRPGGTLALNTTGGGLSARHPGRLGLLLIIEAVQQLRGEAGARQVDGAEIALCHGTGGVLSSSATAIMKRGVG